MPLFNDPNQQRKTATPGRTIGTSVTDRTVNHYVSTPTVDEQREVLLPRGADISRFTKTRTVFDVHNYGSRDVVGRNLSYGIQDDGHVAVTRFADRPLSLPNGVEWHPDTLLHLFDTGDISGWSIGFNPIEYRDPTTKDIGDYPGVQLIHTRFRVLEYSVAPLPCNEDAITRALERRGIISKRLADSLANGHFPKLDEVAAKRTIVIMSGAPLPTSPDPLPVERRVIVLPTLTPPAEIPAEPKTVNVDTVATHAIAIAKGRLYS